VLQGQSWQCIGVTCKTKQPGVAGYQYKSSSWPVRDILELSHLSQPMAMPLLLACRHLHSLQSQAGMMRKGQPCACTYSTLGPPPEEVWALVRLRPWAKLLVRFKFLKQQSQHKCRCTVVGW
jgi:hypothetical protein